MKKFMSLPHVEGPASGSLESHDGGCNMDVDSESKVYPIVAVTDDNDKEFTAEEEADTDSTPLSIVLQPEMISYSGKGSWSQENEQEKVVDWEPYVLAAGKELNYYKQLNSFDSMILPISKKLKKSECLPTARENAQLKELVVCLPTLVHCYFASKWLLDWDHKPKVKMKFMPQHGELISGDMEKQFDLEVLIVVLRQQSILQCRDGKSNRTIVHLYVQFGQRSGRVFTNRSGVYGQLGIPQDRDRFICAFEGMIHEFVMDISARFSYIVVLTSKREVYTWGRYENRQLGLGHTRERNSVGLVETLKGREVGNITWESIRICCDWTNELQGVWYCVVLSISQCACRDKTWPRWGHVSYPQSFTGDDGRLHGFGDEELSAICLLDNVLEVLYPSANFVELKALVDSLQKLYIMWERNIESWEGGLPVGKDFELAGLLQSDGEPEVIEEALWCLGNRSSECPMLVRVWLALQVSILYEEEKRKHFAAGMLKECVSTYLASLFSLGRKCDKSSKKKNDGRKVEELVVQGYYLPLKWLLVWFPKPWVKMRLGKDYPIRSSLWVPFPGAYVPYFPGNSNVEAIDILLRDREANLNLHLERATAWMQNQPVAQWLVHGVHSSLAGATWEFVEEIKAVCFPGFIADDEA